MAGNLEKLVNGVVNVGFGAAAITMEKGKEVLDVLNAKGEEVRKDPAAPDFARSMSDILDQAGFAVSDVTARVNERGEAAAERVLDELILARVRLLNTTERTEFMAHVRDLVDSVDDSAVSVEVEVECDDADEATTAAPDNVEDSAAGQDA